MLINSLNIVFILTTLVSSALANFHFTGPIESLFPLPNQLGENWKRDVIYEVNQNNEIARFFQTASSWPEGEDISVPTTTHELYRREHEIAILADTSFYEIRANGTKDTYRTWILIFDSPDQTLRYWTRLHRDRLAKLALPIETAGFEFDREGVYSTAFRHGNVSVWVSSDADRSKVKEIAGLIFERLIQNKRNLNEPESESKVTDDEHPAAN
ncbi:MAG: hypothetical protein AAFX93_00190 [Verrucomicrobiota bacterium]